MLIAKEPPEALRYLILQDRGRLFLEPQSVCYEGMIVGIHARDNDLVVNVTKEKQLTNMRASGSDEHIILTRLLNLPWNRL